MALTLRQLYIRITRDQVTDGRAIAGALRRQPARRRRLVKLYLRGLTDRQVGHRTRRSYGAARSMLRLTLLSIWKELNHVPRYNRTGRRSPIADRRAAELERIQSYGPPRSLALEAIAAADRHTT